jgi:hypothetical protein
MRWLILLLLVASSCKSIQKAKTLTQMSQSSKALTEIVEDSVSASAMMAEAFKETTADTKEYVTEEVVQTPTVVVLNGQEQVVFTTTSKVIKQVSKKEVTKEDSLTTSESETSESNSSRTKEKDLSLIKDKDVEKESEGMNPMEVLLEGVLGKWGKYVLGAIALISTLMGLWIKYKKINTTSEDENSKTDTE